MTPAGTAYESPQGHVDGLMAEVERYLAAVEVFRVEGCEPVWADDEALGGFRQLEWCTGLNGGTGPELPSVEAEAGTRHWTSAPISQATFGLLFGGK